MLRRWTCSLAAASALLAADEAAACTPDPCADIFAFAGVEPANDYEVPTDGILLIETNWFGELEEEALLAGLTLTVRLADDEVPGTIEPTERTGLLAWRPAELLTPGAVYEVSSSFTNPAGVPSVCAAAVVDNLFEFTAAADPAEPLVPPTMYVDVLYRISPEVGIDALVCCDGAYPADQEFCGISNGLAWSRGQCAAKTALGRLRVDMRAASNLGEPTAGQLVRTLLENGEEVASGLGGRFVRHIAEPTCFAVGQRSLATGETIVGDEQCFGEDSPDPLGELPLDPEMLATCAGQPYTCEVDGDAWDRDACTPWTPDPTLAEPMTGCSCTTAPLTPWPALALLLLLAPRRRRTATIPSIE